MGKRGPKPKPTAVRIFEGDPGRKLPHRQGEIAPPTFDRVPDPPDWLGDHGAAKWKELAPQLHAIGALTRVDCDMLSLYCEAYGDLRAGIEEIEREGRTAISEKGGVYQHPAVGVKNNAATRMKQFGALFGMGPASRVGLNIGSGGGGEGLKKLTDAG